jgi:hypothetical protein
MKTPKIFAIAAVALMALASTASATTLEIKGVKQTGAVAIEATVKAGTSSILTDTSANFANTCTKSTVSGKSSVFTGTTVSGPISVLSWTNCTNEPVVVHKAGTLSVEWIKETSGTVRSNGAEVTVPTGVFGTVNCKTSNTDLGTVSGVSSGTATLALNAVINCGFFLPSARWQGSYIVTTPEGLGVTS